MPAAGLALRGALSAAALAALWRTLGGAALLALLAAAVAGWLLYPALRPGSSPAQVRRACMAQPWIGWGLWGVWHPAGNCLAPCQPPYIY